LLRTSGAISRIHGVAGGAGSSTAEKLWDLLRSSVFEDREVCRGLGRARPAPSVEHRDLDLHQR
jgi:hypothetical protein